MDIDLVNDLRRDDDNEESDDNDDKLKRNTSDDEEIKKADVESVMKKANEVAKKKAPRRPRPKLDAIRLTGPRGLDELTNLLRHEKFKGKGQEFADLDTLMHKFEYWAHRLVPHMAFDDFIEKAENLGAKKQIKNALQYLRDKLNIQTNPDDDKEAGPTLFDILPSINIQNDDNASDNDIHDENIAYKDTHDENTANKNTNNDIPDDEEINELFQ
ncbi:unnamed protein product [Rotaria socialis]|uniref:TIMELESS-interacting protein n=1 Tax=Rotaria socialis TaxID=392032 RepID=A0A817X4X3_9BILA|nr:unnamed protein product [Rotaria socialis]CAF3411336.1 unnamed protein product [Rotaria socialis]CAF3513023.1 unnamed protein product [Rotaria socialis]CAF3572046.1 unnamed protein product [Rotaria socialis]CAF3707440.1 unnamed protein product [Rotaria socialis]